MDTNTALKLAIEYINFVLDNAPETDASLSLASYMGLDIDDREMGAVQNAIGKIIELAETDLKNSLKKPLTK